jgi:hypothetical protein
MAIGANGGNDIIYLLFGARSTADADALTSVTVDGETVDVADTAVALLDEGGGVTSLAAIAAIERNSLPDPDQTDIDVTITWDQSCLRCALDVFVSPNAVKEFFATPTTDTGGGGGADTLVLSQNVPESGIVLAIMYNGDLEVSNWVGLSKHTDATVESANQYSTASSSYIRNLRAATPRVIKVSLAADTFAAAVCAVFELAGEEPGGTAVPVFTNHYRRMKAA